MYSYHRREMTTSDRIYSQSEEIDSELRELTKEDAQVTPNGPSYSFPLSSWVYLYKLRQMEWIILLGFELEVYQPHEFAGMYWYLQHYVRTKIGHIERIRGFAALNPKLSSKQKKKKVIPAVEQQQKALSQLTFYLLEASAIQELSGAMINVFIGFISPRQLIVIDFIPGLHSACKTRFTQKTTATIQFRFPTLRSEDEAVFHNRLSRSCSV